MSAAKFYIPTLPGLPSDSTLTMYGGHIPSAPLVNGVVDSTNDSHLYFFMIKNKHIADTSKTIFWSVPWWLPARREETDEGEWG
jgi:carboxypeptidase D